MFRLIVGSALVASLAFQSGPLRASKFNRVVDPGDKGAAFEKLPCVDGKSYGLSDFADAKAVVLVFTSDNCPVAQSYQQRLAKLADDYKDKGLSLIGINMNKSESLATMTASSKLKATNFFYLRDESQRVARAYGATCTPHVFLLDAQRRIAYMGAIDDNWMDEGRVTASYLRDAVEAVTSGKPPELAEARQVGCAIKWKSR